MEFLEIKKRYNGTEATFRCRLLAKEAERVVLFYETTERHQIDQLILPKGTYTVGYFWTNRPYNVYHWVNRDGLTLGHYFNIVEETVIQDDRVSYRDLIVDVIIYPDGTYRLLDVDELPEPLERFSGGRVKQAVDGIIRSLEAILCEVNSETRRLMIRHG